MRKTYDYQIKVAEARLPLLIGMTALSVVTVGLILIFLFRSLNLRKLNEAEQKTREADERAQIMLEQTPLVVMLWDKDTNILDCNQEALRVTGLSSKKEYMERLFELTPDLPDGTKSSEAAQKAITLCLETGSVRIPWALHHAVTGELIPFDVTVARVKYKGKDVAISYAQDVRERNAAIEKIREADDRARAMIEQAPLVVMLWDKDANILDCNQEALGILGLSSKQEYIDRFFEIAPDQLNGMPSKEAAKMLLSKTLETGFERVEWVLNHPETGEAIPFESIIVRVKYKDKYILMSYGQDMRERNAAMAKMREADERTQLIFDSAPLASCMFDKDLNPLDCNQEMVKMCGLQDKESFLKRHTEFVPEYQPDGSLSSEATARNIQIAFEKGYNQFEFTHRKDSGELFPVKSTLLPVRYRGEDMIAAYFIDLTGQKEAERLTKEVMEKTATISAIFNSTSDMIFCKDINLFYTDCNRAMENYFNIRSSEIAGKHEANALNIPSDIAEHLIALDKKVLSERQEVTTEEMVKSFDGRMLCFEMVRSPLIQEGEITGLVGMARDITKRKAMEEDVKKAYAEAMSAYATAESALEAKNLFVANMNHEMRTPMNVIVGLTDLLLDEEKISGSVKETLYKINTAGNTLMGLIRDILDISKVDAGKMELTPVQYDVASFLNDIITLNIIRIEEKPITFKLDIQENLPRTLHGDDLRVKQILNNLLSNAFKYTKAGTVSLSINCQKDGDVVWTNFRITDTGIGIRKEDMSKLFTNYHQVDAKANRRIEGTGLGLSITKRLVELMNGEIMMDSEYGKGTTFHVRIKQDFVTEETIDKKTLESLRTFHYSDDKKRAQKKFERADLSYARVLVVDDFPTNLDVASGMLRKYKMKVDCVSSGQESIDVIALGKPVYDAIFMDHMMPEMDGIEAVKLIRALDTDYAKNIPIIALTANAVSDSEKMFLDNGFNAFLPKPFNAMSLDAVVQQWVKKSEQ
jgi:PAS domain S-box-containing protein